MEQTNTGVPEGLAQYLSDLLAGLPLPPAQRGRALPPPEVVKGECGASVALFQDPVPAAPEDAGVGICAGTLGNIVESLSSGASLWETAGCVGMEVDDVAKAVTTLGGFTTKRWRGQRPPRADEPLGDGYRRSRKHPYALERSAVTIRGSHAAGEMDEALLAAAAERLGPPVLGAEDLTSVLSFWVFRQKLRGQGEEDPPEELAGAVHRVASTTRDTVNAAAVELVALLDGRDVAAPNLEGLAPDVAAEVRGDSAFRCAAVRALLRDPAAYLPVRFRDLTPGQVQHLAVIAAGEGAPGNHPHPGVLDSPTPLE